MIVELVKQKLKPHNLSPMYYNLVKRTHFYSVSQSTAGKPPILRPPCRQVQLVKGYSRFPQKVKELGLPAPGIFSSTLSASKTSFRELGFVSWYLGIVKTRPILTKSVTCALIYTAADLSSQAIASSSEQYDLLRTLRMAGFGMLIAGPSLHFWFNFASKTLPKLDAISTLKKIVLGHMLYSPIMTAVFFTVNSVLQGESGMEIVARLKSDMAPTLINGLFYWSVSDFIIYRLIPVHLQTLASNGFSYVWTIYLTYMATLDKADVLHDHDFAPGSA